MRCCEKLLCTDLQRKIKKAKNVVQEINSQESNISSVATLSGSKYSADENSKKA